MKSLLITNIKNLYGLHPAGKRMLKGQEMAQLPSLEQAYMLVENGCISGYGSMQQAPERAEKVMDAAGGSVLPAWCDSHTHLVHAGPRETEFVDKIKGLTYEQIAARGGGILNSAAKLADTSEVQLLDAALQRLQEAESLGTGAIEIKSGYGLSEAGELKMLRVIRSLKQQSKLTIKATFLGAHAYPAAYKENKEGYMQLLLHRLLPQVAAEGLADYIDAFCEQGYFSVEDTERLLEAGEKLGLRAKVHVNQFNAIGGVQACIRHQALSVDHLEVLTDADVQALRKSETMPTALPGCSFYLRIPYTQGRQLIDAGLPLALASDYNPGSSPSFNMNLVVSLGCIQMRLLPEEAVNAATLNSAYAMGVEDQLGSIAIGKRANFIITRPIPSLAYLPYSFGSNLIQRVVIAGT